MGIMEAKKVKERLIEVMKTEHPSINAQIRLFFDNKDLALEMTLDKKVSTTWVQNYQGLKLVVIEPA